MQPPSPRDQLDRLWRRGCEFLGSRYAILGGAMMAAAIPAGMVFDNESPRGRLVFGALALTVLVCGVGAFVLKLGGSSDGDLSGSLLAAS